MKNRFKKSWNRFVNHNIVDQILDKVEEYRDHVQDFHPDCIFYSKKKDLEETIIKLSNLLK